MPVGYPKHGLQLMLSLHFTNIFDNFEHFCSYWTMNWSEKSEIVIVLLCSPIRLCLTNFVSCLVYRHFKELKHIRKGKMVEYNSGMPCIPFYLSFQEFSLLQCDDPLEKVNRWTFFVLEFTRARYQNRHYQPWSGKNNMSENLWRIIVRKVLHIRSIYSYPSMI